MNHFLTKGENIMKKFLIAGLMICGFSAQADMGLEDRYINLQVGVGTGNFNSMGLENSRIVLSYGMDIESNMSYMGFTEIGIKAPVALLSFKYGYEFMRHDNFSFGADIVVLIGIPGHSIGTSNMINDLALGDEVGAFIKMKATDDVSVFIRGGVLYETPFRSLGSFTSYIVPFADIGIQYNL